MLKIKTVYYVKFSLYFEVNIYYMNNKSENQTDLESSRHLTDPYFFEILIEGTESSSSATEKEELISEHLKNLVEKGHIPEARNLLSKIPSGISKKLDYWQKVLY